MFEYVALFEKSRSVVNRRERGRAHRRMQSIAFVRQCDVARARKTAFRSDVGRDFARACRKRQYVHLFAAASMRR